MLRKLGSLDRRQAVQALLAERGELLIVAGLGSAAYDTFAAGDHDANFYLWGAMGGAAMLGLGLALAQPTKPVAVLTGDGEQLMGIGSLLTVSVKRPSNLTIVVLDNGHFGETGMQLSHSGLGIEMGEIARTAGFALVREVNSIEAIHECRPMLQSITAGPRFIKINIAPGNPERALPARDGVYLKNRFREHLGLSVS